LPRGEARRNAVTRQTEEVRERLTTDLKAFFWMSERVRAAADAEGRSCSAGIVTVERVYDTPCVMSVSI